MRQHPPQKMLETIPENRHISCIEDKHGWKDMLRFRETYNLIKVTSFQMILVRDFHSCKCVRRIRSLMETGMASKKKSAAFCRVCYMLRPFKARFDKHQPFLVMSKEDISQTFSDDQLEGKIVVSSQALTRGDIHHSSKIRTYTPKL